jgi:uncharacterized membrane protein
MSASPVVPDGSRSLLRTNRFEAFSDGVFAIAITILVLELGVPETAVEHPLQSVLDEWPTYVAYVVSFASVGALWLEHNAITEHLRVTDTVLIRLNLLLLLLVSFLRFPTGLLSEFHGNSGAERYCLDQALPEDQFYPTLNSAVKAYRAQSGQDWQATAGAATGTDD